METKDITQIRIGSYTAGIIGLKALLQEMAGSHVDQSDAIVSAFMLEQLGRSNYIPSSARAEYGKAFVREFRKFLGQPYEEDAQRGLEIKVFGPGCTQCDGLEKVIMEVLEELRLPANVDHVRDVKEIARQGIMGVPALMINGKVVAKGSIPPKNKLKLWLQEASQA